MRMLSPLFASLFLAGCQLSALPTAGVGAPEREGLLGTTSYLGSRGNLVTGGSNVIAAGGANVIAAGGANVVAAGGANALGTERTPVAAAPVIAAGGGNLIASGSAPVIAAGGMNLSAPTAPTAPRGEVSNGGSGNWSGDTPVGGEIEMAPAGSVTGFVKGHGALIALQDGLVPVGQAYVGLYDLTGAPVGQPVLTDDKGAFTLQKVPSYQLLFLRCQFSYNGKDYYLSTPFRLEGAEVAADLTPMTTISEARLFARATGIPSHDFLLESYMDAFWAATQALNNKVPASALRAGASIDDRAKAYDSLAILNAAAFKNDILALFEPAGEQDPASVDTH